MRNKIQREKSDELILSMALLKHIEGSNEGGYNQGYISLVDFVTIYADQILRVLEDMIDPDMVDDCYALVLRDYLAEYMVSILTITQESNHTWSTTGVPDRVVETAIRSVDRLKNWIHQTRKSIAERSD